MEPGGERRRCQGADAGCSMSARPPSSSGRTCAARRAGAIPGARQRGFEDFLTADGTFHSLEAMLALVRAGGVVPGDMRAVYCHSGVRSSLVWFVLHELAGFDDGSQLRRVVGGVGQPRRQPDRDAVTATVAEPGAGLLAPLL